MERLPPLREIDVGVRLSRRAFVAFLERGRGDGLRPLVVDADFTRADRLTTGQRADGRERCSGGKSKIVAGSK